MATILRSITEIARCGNQYRTEQLKSYGIRGVHASALLEICRNPGISQDELARRICLNKSNAARQAAKLEESGYILRKTSESDKRVLELYPTEKALQVQPDIVKTNRAWREYLTGDLSEQEIQMVVEVLERMQRKAAAWLEEK